jgi:hypothetical protein
MEMINVKSSNIKAIGYDSKTLYVEYKSGDWYEYRSVDKATYKELLSAKSKGQYMNYHIKPNYVCKKLFKGFVAK